MLKWKPAHFYHIISKGNKWGIYKPKARRSIHSFKHREQAYERICNICFRQHLNAKIIVHNKDATIVFMTNIWHGTDFEYSYFNDL